MCPPGALRGGGKSLMDFFATHKKDGLPIKKPPLLTQQRGLFSRSGRSAPDGLAESFFTAELADYAYVVHDPAVPAFCFGAFHRPEKALIA